MKASILDLRRRMKDILRALDRRESVTILYRGKPKAVMHPMPERSGGDRVRVADHPSFGMWKDRDDLRDVTAHVRSLRRGRLNDL